MCLYAPFLTTYYTQQTNNTNNLFSTSSRSAATAATEVANTAEIVALSTRVAKVAAYRTTSIYTTTYLQKLLLVCYACIPDSTFIKFITLCRCLRKEYKITQCLVYSFFFAVAKVQRYNITNNSSAPTTMCIIIQYIKLKK